MIKGIIFDLDRCIFDTGGMELNPVLEVLHTSVLPDSVKASVEDELRTTSLADTAKRHDLPEELVARMRDAYRLMRVPKDACSFGDEAFIESLPVMKILVTSGIRQLQEEKIEKIEVAELFDEIIIDDIDLGDERPGKRGIFEDILSRHGWAPDEVLVVGDNPYSELAAGHALGMRTIQTLRTGVHRWDGADGHITSFAELPGLLGENRL